MPVLHCRWLYGVLLRSGSSPTDLILVAETLKARKLGQTHFRCPMRAFVYDDGGYDRLVKNDLESIGRTHGCLSPASMLNGCRWRPHQPARK